MTDEDFKPNLEADCQHEMRFMSHREGGKWVCCLCVAVEAEREACACVAEDWGTLQYRDTTYDAEHAAYQVAEAIRARSNPKADSAKTS